MSIYRQSISDIDISNRATVEGIQGEQDDNLGVSAVEDIQGNQEAGSAAAGDIPGLGEVAANMVIVTPT